MAPIAQYAPQLHGIVHDPLAAAKFTLNAFGVAGFFGGETAVNGMATVIFFFRGRWGGLYNTPGSLEIAKRYGQLASPRLFRGLFPGDTRDPSQLFGLDDKPGPKFLAACSGSLFEKTGHLGYLVARMAKNETCKRGFALAETEDSGQRITSPATVTVIDLTHLGTSKPDKIVHPTLPYKHYGFFALIPIAASIGACIGCALVGDWWSFSSIALGMIANGWACFVLGLGKLTFQHPEPAGDAPMGDGILWASDNAVVVIRGTERAVNTVTRGHFFLHYGECACKKRASMHSQVDQLDTASHTAKQDAPLPADVAPKGYNLADSAVRVEPRTDELLNVGTDPEASIMPTTTDTSPTATLDARSSNSMPNMPPERTIENVSPQPVAQDDMPQVTSGSTNGGTALTEMEVPLHPVAKDSDVPATGVPPLIPAVTADMPLPPPAEAPIITTDPPANTASGARSSESCVAQDAPSSAIVGNEPSSDAHAPPLENRAFHSTTPSSQKVQRDPDNAHESRKPDSLSISVSSILLTIQFVAQLLLIPQASVFGQLMFVSTLAVSWGYNVFISSIDSEDVQTRLLCDILQLKEVQKAGGDNGRDVRRRAGVQKFEFGTWTAMAVFACLALRPKSSPAPEPNDPLRDSRDLSKVLNALIPNDTEDWNEWKGMMGKKLRSSGLLEPEMPCTASGLLQSIIGDAQVAYRRYSSAFPEEK